MPRRGRSPAEAVFSPSPGWVISVVHYRDGSFTTEVELATSEDVDLSRLSDTEQLASRLIFVNATVTEVT